MKQARTKAKATAAVAKPKRATLDQLKDAYRKVDKLTDDDDSEAALVLLDSVLAGFDFTPREAMILADEQIEWVGGCFRMRGTVAVLGPPYARATALADSERDFRTAITWLSLGLSSPGFAYIGLCETLIYEAEDYARGIAEADRGLANRRLDAKQAGYVKFYITKAKAYAQLALDQLEAAKKTFADATKRSREDRRYRTHLDEDFDRIETTFPRHAGVVKKLRAGLAA